MIKHIVCFKLADASEENIIETKKVLLSMRGKVPIALDIQVNSDELRTARSYDIILEVKLENFEALDKYQEDPYHTNIVIKHMRAVVESSIALDFTI